ncbi:sensor histidine kinase [Tunicatimonas pelagia]|uniref:sensor histidine kinase n=1 Tax=Tunicatimonas pelagia TaxID=931531 RepID=UPI002664FDA6|nr:PAS domain-containing sensor histidine kinase [Tunicatimonas pelagia]WKN45584.1 PAS domain-containing sensor histidine kinase [Tunicatimonas pelagia]
MMLKGTSPEDSLMCENKYDFPEKLLRSYTDIVLVFNEDLNVCFANSYAEDLLNYKEQALIDQHITQVFPKRQHRLLESIIESVEDGRNVRERRTYLHVRRKRNIPVSLSFTFIQSDHTFKYILIAKDQQQYTKATDALKQKNEELKTLIYRASHDLKGPLASVKGLFNLLADEPEDTETLKYYLSLIERSVDKLEDTLSGLLELGLSSKKELQFTSFSIRECLEEIIERFENYPGREEVIIHLTANEDLTLHTEKKIFESIFQNLVENSIKYRKPDQNDAVTKISVRRYKHGLKIKVKDNGLGMDRNLQKRAFDMFYRGHEHAEGSGLGLFIVKNNAEKLGGEIKIKASLNMGTEIQVYLPDMQKIEEENAKSSVGTKSTS